MSRLVKHKKREEDFAIFKGLTYFYYGNVFEVDTCLRRIQEFLRCGALFGNFMREIDPQEPNAFIYFFFFFF